MLVGDLVYNDDFDCNCRVEIYDCSEQYSNWYDGGILIHDNAGWEKPLDSILDMEIVYITTEFNKIIIEARKMSENILTKED